MSSICHLVQSPLLAWTPALIGTAMTSPLALTDQQLDTVRRTAATLQVNDRDALPLRSAGRLALMSVGRWQTTSMILPVAAR
jgi:hypothetical protein